MGLIKLAAETIFFGIIMFCNVECFMGKKKIHKIIIMDGGFLVDDSDHYVVN